MVMKSIVIGFMLTLIQNIAVVLVLPALKSTALGVMLAASAFFALINPADAAVDNTFQYSAQMQSPKETTKNQKVYLLNAKFTENQLTTKINKEDLDEHKNISTKTKSIPLKSPSTSRYSKLKESGADYNIKSNEFFSN